MHTRADYMQGRCTHEQYYAQFVTAEILQTVRHDIGEQRIKASTDPHFNDIPLAQWDSLPIVPVYPDGIGDFPTLAGLVCIAKAAAEIIKAA